MISVRFPYTNIQFDSSKITRQQLSNCKEGKKATSEGTTTIINESKVVSMTATDSSKIRRQGNVQCEVSIIYTN